MNKKCKTSVGGQAVIEGVMMKNKDLISMSVRLQDGLIDNECWKDNISDKWYSKVPLIRGCINFVYMMILGYKCLMKSAQKIEVKNEGEDLKENEKTSKLEEVLGENIFKVFMALSTVFGFAISIFLFMWFPSFLVKLLSSSFIMSNIFKSLLEGVIKVIIFILYISLTSLMKDMKTVYMYHGAEHKSIACYEAGKEITVENVRKQTRFHSRCGTSFILFVLVVSILVFSVISWDNVLTRVLTKLIFMPLVIGISYEIIKFTSSHQNKFTRIFILPGLWLQRITTREPNDEQIEVAIDALKHVI